MTHNIHVDFLGFTLENAEISSRKIPTSGEADSEPTIFLVDAIFHLKEHVSLGPVNHPRELRFFRWIKSDLMHLTW